MEVGRIIMHVFLILFGIGLFVFLQGYIMNLDMSGWTFGGHEFVATIIPIMPTIFIIVMTVIPIYFIMKEIQ